MLSQVHINRLLGESSQQRERCNQLLGEEWWVSILLICSLNLRNPGRDPLKGDLRELQNKSKVHASYCLIIKRGS